MKEYESKLHRVKADFLNCYDSDEKGFIIFNIDLNLKYLTDKIVKMISDKEHETGVAWELSPGSFTFFHEIKKDLSIQPVYPVKFVGVGKEYSDELKNEIREIVKRQRS